MANGFVRQETATYRLWQLPYGFELMRKSDARRAFFQGDDADLWEANMISIEGIKQWNAGNTLDKSFDCLCSGYDDVLQDG